MTLDERIRQDLNSAAGLSPSAEMAPVETVMATGKRRRRRKSGTAVGLAATLTIGAVLMTQPIPPLTPEALAGDAEILKSDPLAVRGEESPRPSFGPQWTLGEDRNLLPVEDVDGFIAQVRPRGGWLRTLPETYSYIHPPAGKLLRLDIVGYTPGGAPIVVTHTETLEVDGETVRWRCAGVAGNCIGDPVRQLPPLPDGLVQPRLDTRVTWTSGIDGTAAPSDGLLGWDVAPETSVAMLTVNGRRYWQRPIAQVAVFDVSLALGDRLVFTEFDGDGQVIYSGNEIFREDGTSMACPVTYPLDNPFTPPPPNLDEGMGSPQSSANPGILYNWYGTEDLWTYIPIDGTHGLDRATVNKGPFWSVNFPGGGLEGEPEISVTMRQLDGDGYWENSGRGTNAYTEPDGWFMFAGYTHELGCWEVTATYKGARLTFVYEN